MKPCEAKTKLQRLFDQVEQTLHAIDDTSVRASALESFEGMLNGMAFGDMMAVLLEDDPVETGGDGCAAHRGTPIATCSDCAGEIE